MIGWPSFKVLSLVLNGRSRGKAALALLCVRAYGRAHAFPPLGVQCCVKESAVVPCREVQVPCVCVGRGVGAICFRARSACGVNVG